MREPRPVFSLALVLGAVLAVPVLAGATPGSGVDVLHYTFGLDLSDESDTIVGETTVLLRLDDLAAPEVELDLVGRGEDGLGMVVQEVTDGADVPLAWVHHDDRLRILLRSSKKGEADAARLRRVVVRYAGMPEAGLFIGPNRYGERTFFSDNWPEGARHWLPTVDHPADKARCDFVVTAPAHYQVVANGRLVEEVDLPGERRRTVWETGAPIPTKVMALGVGHFAVHNYGDAGGVPVVPVEGWLFLPDVALGVDVLGGAREMIDFYAARLGPFPYAKLAIVQSTTRFGGMENAGAVFIGQDRFDDPELLPGLLAHEVAHQWFGDSLTESDWNELWLSEGFATYFRLLYLESRDGERRFEEEMAEARRRVLTWTVGHPGQVLRPPSPADPDELLNTNTYQKGAWVLHMLRREVGDEVFWQAMASYSVRFRDSNVRTLDVQRVVEDFAGRDLGWFFHQWLEQPGHPQLEVSSRFDAAAGELAVGVRQLQSEPVFRARLELEARSAAGEAVPMALELRDRETRGRFALAWEPSSIVIDPRVDLLYEEASEPAPDPQIPTP